MLRPVPADSASFYKAWREDPHLLSRALWEGFHKVRMTDVVELKPVLKYLSKRSPDLPQLTINQLVGRGFIAPEKGRPHVYRITERGLSTMETANPAKTC